jgi:4-diphosphocytidyl-2C-methyl-D-erythritol kinase
MIHYQAPAKLNLSLLVEPPRGDGYHPLESLVQTVEWCDLLEVGSGEEGTDTIEPDIEDNLVERALTELRKQMAVPPFDSDWSRRSRWRPGWAEAAPMRPRLCWLHPTGWR